LIAGFTISPFNKTDPVIALAYSLVIFGDGQTEEDCVDAIVHHRPFPAVDLLSADIE
jgi:hypothetical protein